MTYKEVLVFVAKCLTISHEEHNRILVEKKLQENTINWNLVVQFSTGQFVLPALYCNLKRVDLLHYLPDDLVALMEYIADLNRKRNHKLMAQAKEINQLLLTNNITPIFLKGAGNLLENLYEDTSERMVGDIDFIVREEEVDKTAAIFDELGYSNGGSIYSKGSRHLPTLMHQKKIANVEIHTELLPKPYRTEFNYNLIKQNVKIINDIHVISFENQLALSIIADQINDSGFLFKNISLRNAYDVFLLSKKTEAKTNFNRFDRLKHPLSCFLATSFYVFNKPSSLQYESTKEIEAYLKSFNEELGNTILRNKRQNKIKREKKIKNKLRWVYRLFFDKVFRVFIIKKLKNKNLWKKKIKQLI
tara:strand:- start:99 stop:1181 length:1083 start_codon:yes stop_codon:yes gene_type:complete